MNGSREDVNGATVPANQWLVNDRKKQAAAAF